MSHDLPYRATIRLPDFDYSSPNWYYVTICTQDRLHILGDCVGASRDSPAYIQLTQYGQIVNDIWHSLPSHHPISLDQFVIMPNHLHGIIVINHTGESRLAPTLGTIIGMFKSQCSKQIHSISDNSNQIIWQRNYYEHIIRDEGELNHVRQYIMDNPKNWEKDKLFNQLS